MIEGDGKGMLYLPVTNFAGGNLDVVRDMIDAPNSLIGLGDGGAHVGIMCDATATSYTLTHWTRDRARGSLFPVSWIVKRLTADKALALLPALQRAAAALSHIETDATPAQGLGAALAAVAGT